MHALELHAVHRYSVNSCFPLPWMVGNTMRSRESNHLLCNYMNSACCLEGNASELLATRHNSSDIFKIWGTEIFWNWSQKSVWNLKRWQGDNFPGAGTAASCDKSPVKCEITVTVKQHPHHLIAQLVTKRLPLTSSSINISPPSSAAPWRPESSLGKLCARAGLTNHLWNHRRQATHAHRSSPRRSNYTDLHWTAIPH